MDIIACLKRVPDTGARLEIESNGLEVKADFPWILNPYDEFAIEEAIRIRDRAGGKVTLIHAGPEGGEEVLKKGIAMGADSAVYVKDPRLDGLDEVSIARVLTAVLSKFPFDMILCGKQGTDSDAGVVGSALAGLLNIPIVSAVKRLTLFPEERRRGTRRVPYPGGAGLNARRTYGRIEGGGGRGMEAPCHPGGADGQGRLSEALYRLRDIRRPSAHKQGCGPPVMSSQSTKIPTRRSFGRLTSAS